MASLRGVSAVVALVVTCALAAACGGKVITPGGEGGDGGGGASGGSGTGAAGITNPKDCPTADCETNGDGCTCETMCGGPKLRASCKVHDGGMIICECHYDGGYMGTCSASGGSVCGLPDGCCEAYVP